MTKTLCIVCSVEMRPEKNGVWVLETAGQHRQLYKIWSADLVKYPGCGMQVVVGFANRPTARYEDDFDTELTVILNQSQIPVFYDHEKPD